MMKEKEEQNIHIGQLNNQINKYKVKIRELTESGSGGAVLMEEK
jgi:hypothetical protein